LQKLVISEVMAAFNGGYWIGTLQQLSSTRVWEPLPWMNGLCIEYPVKPLKI